MALSPSQPITDKATKDFIEIATKEHGSSARTFKSGLIWAVPDAPDALRDEARKVLAWEDIDDEKGELRLDEAQLRQLEENVKKARRDVKETVWRTYKNLVLLGKQGDWKTIDLGLVHSSAANSLTELIVERLRQDGDLESAISPDFLVRNWPPAFKEWSTKSARDMFFASPQFPRLLDPDSLKDTIARGVGNQILGYVGKKPDGTYAPFHWKSSLSILDVEISADMYIIQADTAKAYAAAQATSFPPGRDLKHSVRNALESSNHCASRFNIRTTSRNSPQGVFSHHVAGRCSPTKVDELLYKSVGEVCDAGRPENRIEC